MSEYYASTITFDPAEAEHGPYITRSYGHQTNSNGDVSGYHYDLAEVPSPYGNLYAIFSTRDDWPKRAETWASREWESLHQLSCFATALCASPQTSAFAQELGFRSANAQDDVHDRITTLPSADFLRKSLRIYYANIDEPPESFFMADCSAGAVNGQRYIDMLSWRLIPLSTPANLEQFGHDVISAYGFSLMPLSWVEQIADHAEDLQDCDQDTLRERPTFGGDLVSREGSDFVKLVRDFSGYIALGDIRAPQAENEELASALEHYHWPLNPRFMKICNLEGLRHLTSRNQHPAFAKVLNLLGARRLSRDFSKNRHSLNTYATTFQNHARAKALASKT